MEGTSRSREIIMNNIDGGVRRQSKVRIERGKKMGMKQARYIPVLPYSTYNSYQFIQAMQHDEKESPSYLLQRERHTMTCG